MTIPPKLWISFSRDRLDSDIEYGIPSMHDNGDFFSDSCGLRKIDFRPLNSNHSPKIGHFEATTTQTLRGQCYRSVVKFL